MAFAGRPKGRCFPHYCSWRNLSITIDKKRQPKPPLEPASLPATATRFIRHAQWTFCPQQPSHSQESHKYPVTVSLSFQGCFYLLFSYFFKKEKEKGDIKGGKNPKVTFKCDFWSQETALGWPSSWVWYAFSLPSSEGGWQSHPAGCMVPVFRREWTRHWWVPAWDAPTVRRRWYCLRLNIVIALPYVSLPAYVWFLKSMPT